MPGWATHWYGHSPELPRQVSTATSWYPLFCSSNTLLGSTCRAATSSAQSLSVNQARPTALDDRVGEDHLGLGERVGHAIHDALGVLHRLAACVPRIVAPEEHLLVPPLGEHLEDEVVVCAVWGSEVEGF